jgi:hypothetical protein
MGISFLRSWLRPAKPVSSPRRGAKSRTRLQLEILEDRATPAISTVGIPDWFDQGPGPMINAQLQVPPNDPAGGAVQSIAVHPNQVTHMIIGTVNGGLWRTTNANTAVPANTTWTPLTDNLGSLSGGAVAYDTADATGNTFYYGTGEYSNSFDGAGRAVGAYRTTDGGATWTLLGTATPGGNPLPNVAIKSILVNGNTILISGVNTPTINQRNYRLLGGALFRSTDGGAVFTQEVGVGATDLPAGAVSSVVQDPNNANRVYASVPGQGIFRSDDFGDTWTPVNTGLGLTGNESTLELAVEDLGANTTVYVAVANGDTLNGVFSTTNAGGNWNALPGGLPAGFSAGASFADKMQIIVDPDNAGFVYLAGQSGAGGEVFRYDPAGGGVWTFITGANANNTTPHVDSHDLRFLGNDTLVYASDGGLYFLNNPDNIGANQWQSFNGVEPNGIRAVEFFAVAYDPNGNRIMGGSQDNGSEIQTGLNSQTWDHVQDGDGQNQEYDAVNNIRYGLGNNFGNFDRAAGGGVGAQMLLRAPASAVNFSGLQASDRPVAGGFNFFQAHVPFILNSQDPTRILIGRNGLYESDPAAIVPTGDSIVDITPGGMAQARALAYGGERGGNPFVNVVVVGTGNGQLFFRGEAGAAFTNVSDGGAGELAGIGSVEDIVLDPEDWRRVYVLQGDQIWVTNNIEDLANNPFTDVTDNLGRLTDEVRSIELYDNTPATAGDSILLAGGFGGVFRRLIAPVGGCADATWTEYGRLLPNVMVQDVRVNLDDVDANAANGIGRLIAGTMGRGAWTIDNISATIGMAGVVTVTGDGNANNMFLQQDLANPNRIIVDDGLGNVQAFDRSLFSLVQFLGAGGDDTIRIDSNGATAGGDVNFVTFMVNVDAGGQANDLTILEDAADTTADRVTITPTTVGAADPVAGTYAGDNFFGECGRLTYSNTRLTVNLSNDTTAGDTVFVQGTSGITTLNGNGGNDIFHLNSDAPSNTPTDTGHLNNFAAAITIDAGAGAANRIIASDQSGAANGNVVVTNNSITGLAPSAINYSATGGNFTNGAANNGILIRGSDAGNDIFNVRSTLTGSTTRIEGLGGNDTFNVASDAPTNTGNLDNITGLLTIDAGTGAANRLIVTDQTGAANGGVTVTNSKITGLAPADINYSATGGNFTNGVNKDGILISGSDTGNDVFNVTSTLAGSSLTINGLGGDDTFTIAGDGLGGDNFFRGGVGTDTFTVNAGTGITGTSLCLSGDAHPAGSKDSATFNGTGNDDLIEMRYGVGVLGERLTGLGTLVRFDTIEDVTIDGKGGNNTLRVIDDTNKVYGSALNPASGIVYRPTGAASGDVRVNLDANGDPTLPSETPMVRFGNINLALEINGDGDNSGDKDVLVVLGVSTNGMSSGNPFNETTSANGSDVINVTDTSVSITNAALGALRSVTLTGTGGPAFTALVLRAGNEAPPVGDDVTATPSKRLNIFLDGMDPKCGDPGDKLTVLTVGPRQIVAVNDPLLGPPHVRIVQTSDGASVGFIHFETIAGVGISVTGADAGGGPQVRVFDSITGAERLPSFFAFPVGFLGGVRVAAGDVTGDGIPDVIAAAGVSGGPQVRIFDGISGAEVRSFFAYDMGFRGGVFVAAGDVNCDGFADIITGVGVSGGPHVRVFSGATGAELYGFFAYSPGFLGGVRVASGDVNGDGSADIITGAGQGGGPHVRVFNGTNAAELFGFITPFTVTFPDGVYVGAGDVDGDKRADILVGAGRGGPPQVFVYSGATGGLLRSFFVNDPFAPDSNPEIALQTGIRVATSDVSGDGIADILVANGLGTLPRLRAYRFVGGLTELRNELVYSPLFAGGVFVGGK